jgi:hypothetical protein
VVPHDPHLAIVDSLPVPVCQFARAYRCRRFAGEAAYGKDIVARHISVGDACPPRCTLLVDGGRDKLQESQGHAIAVLANRHQPGDSSHASA